MDNTKTLYTCAWGDYWEKYGEKWLNQLYSLNTFPDQLFIICDKPLKNCPLKMYLCDPHQGKYTISYFRKKAIEKSTSTWTTFSDLDDIMHPNYLDNLDPTYDMIAISLNYIDYNYNVYKEWISSDPENINRWENYPTPGFPNPSTKLMAYPGQSFVKTHLLQKHGINKYGFQDTTLHYKLRKDNIKVKTDSTIRYSMIETPNSLSRNNTSVPMKREETKIFKEYLFENQKTPLHISVAETV